MSIASILESNRNKRIKVLIVGDVCRDEWHVGEVSRTAQEAPVPVLSSGEPIVVPGGAGNVARQLKHWNADVPLLTVVDRDMEDMLRRHHDSMETWHWGWMERWRGRNPIKRRFVSRGQILFRQDIELPDYGASDIHELRSIFMGNFQTSLQAGADIVILSDYAKGLFDGPTLRAIIIACQEHGVPVIADPHCSRHPHDYAGVTVFKPNEEYVKERGGRHFRFPGNLYWFKKTLSPTKHMVYTRGSEPPCGFIGTREDSENFVCQDRHNPVHAVNVVGAGDCFTAHLAVGMAHGLPFKEACELAYSAGREYVKRPYNEPVMPCEVVQNSAKGAPIGKLLLTAEEIRRYLDVRHPKGRIVFTNGVFRLPHSGHATMLRWARLQGDVLVVGINDNDSARRVKSDSFCLSATERMVLLGGLECVDFVVPFSEDTPEKIMEVIRPDVLVKGPDNAGRDIPGASIVREVRIAPETGLPHASDIEGMMAMHWNDSLRDVKCVPFRGVSCPS